MESTKTTKTTKDPNAPKKPLTSYFLFAKDVRPEIMKNNPTAKITEIATLIGAEWKKLSDDDKKKYTQKADEAKAEYIKAKTAYES